MCTIKSIREAVGDYYGETEYRDSERQSAEALDRLDKLLPLHPRMAADLTFTKSFYACPNTAFGR